MIRPGGLFIIAAGLCGIALIRKASSDIADAFADSDSRTLSLAGFIAGVGGVCSDPERGGGMAEQGGAGASQQRTSHVHEKGLSA